MNVSAALQLEKLLAVAVWLDTLFVKRPFNQPDDKAACIWTVLGAGIVQC